LARRSTKKIASCLLHRLPAGEFDGQQPVGMFGMKRVGYDVAAEDRRLVLGGDFERQVSGRVPRCGQKSKANDWRRAGLDQLKQASLREGDKHFPGKLGQLRRQTSRDRVAIDPKLPLDAADEVWRVREDRSTITNQATGVIGMGVGQDHEVDLLRFDARCSKIFKKKMPFALEASGKITVPGVDQHAFVRGAHKKRLARRPDEAPLVCETPERPVSLDLRHAREQELARESHPTITHQAAERRADRERSTHSSATVFHPSPAGGSLAVSEPNASNRLRIAESTYL
jgi:hypothetical protein